MSKAIEILNSHADKGDSVIETNLSEIYFSLLDFKQAVERIRKVAIRGVEENHLYAGEILINEMLIDKSVINDLLQLEKDNKIKIIKREEKKRFNFFKIKVVGVNYNNQEIFLKFNKKQKLVAAEINIKKTEDWVMKSSFEKIMDGMYRRVSKKENEIIYKNNKRYIKLTDILAEEMLQITFGEF